MKSRVPLFYSHVTTDEHGRRRIPLVRTQAPQKNIILLGDSITWGEGVNDNQNFAYHLASYRPDTEVVNLGIPGGGPNNFLYELEHLFDKRVKGTPVRKGIAIYTYIDNHLDRMVCRMRCMLPQNRWMRTKPYYVLSGNGVEWKGFFDSDRVFLNAIYGFLSKSALLDYFKVQIPPRFSAAHFELFARIVKKSFQILKERVGVEEFYVVFFPGGFSDHSGDLIPYLQNHGIQYLDYSRISTWESTKNQESIPGEGHPSPQAHYLYGYLLNRDLPR
jgi:hypothetical protein